MRASETRGTKTGNETMNAARQHVANFNRASRISRLAKGLCYEIDFASCPGFWFIRIDGRSEPKTPTWLARPWRGSLSNPRDKTHRPASITPLGLGQGGPHNATPLERRPAITRLGTPRPGARHRLASRSSTARSSRGACQRGRHSYPLTRSNAAATLRPF